MATEEQLRAGRALVGLSQAKLAELVGVSTKTIKRAEGSGSPKPADDTVEAIGRALENQGIIFIEENGGGAGVRLAKPKQSDD